MSEQFPKPVDKEALRQEIAERFPGVDASQLSSEDIDLYQEISSRGIKRRKFDAWMAKTSSEVSAQYDHPRMKFVMALNRDLPHGKGLDETLTFISKNT
jgi:hypothetical protein